MGLIRLAQLQKGIHENCYISKVDIKDRKGKNGIINKMVYITINKMGKKNKPIAQVEVSWWKPDPTSDYFKTNLQEISLQLHNILEAYMDTDEAFEAFENVFEAVGISNYKEIETRKWKQSEVNKLLNIIAEAFEEAIKPYVGKTDKLIRVKLTTNYKGEGTEVPKYGKWVELMDKEETELYFTDNELKTHSKGGITTVAAASSVNTATTI